LFIKKRKLYFYLTSIKYYRY